MSGMYREGMISLPGARAQKKVLARIRSIIDDDLIEYGRAFDTGHLGTKDDEGVEFVERSFRTVDNARDYIVEHASKSGPILAARITNKGQPYWYYGAWCRD